MAGKTYPGNFEFDALKKSRVKAIQLAKNRLGDSRQDLTRRIIHKLRTTLINIGVHGKSASRTIGM